MTICFSLLVPLLHLLTPVVRSENVGWRAYFNEERCPHTSICRDYFVKRHGYSVTAIITAIISSSEFHDLPLTWENGAEVPTWLSGTYVR